MLAAALIASTLSGCKRQKPPAMTRVWLGANHACGTIKSGDVVCWGSNTAGQLGDATVLQSAWPVRAASAPLSPDDLAIGARHTCSLSAEHVRCWGDDSHGQVSLLKSETRATAIAAAGDRTCLRTREGTVRCWGEGRDPAPLAGVTGVALLAVAPDRVCAATTEPSLAVRCSQTDRAGHSEEAEPVLSGATVKGLTVGGKHSCALLGDGSVGCWGGNDFGQLGDGTQRASRAPAIVRAIPQAVEVRAGNNHTCARLYNDTVACWGDNRAHQLANGGATPSSTPVPITGLVGVVELAVGGDSACARMRDGGVRCWGANSAGQLGDGTTVDHDVPMPIRSPRSSK